MNFKENYQREMNEITKPSGITEKILRDADNEQKLHEIKKTRGVLRNGTTRRTAVAAIAITCVLVLCLQHENISSFAQSIFSSFHVSVDDEEVDFGNAEPIDIDIDTFINDDKTKIVGGGEPAPSYYQVFTSYQEMKELTHLELPRADKIAYGNISLHIIPEYKNGHLGVLFSYNGVTYNMNAMFALDGFDQKDWGYGTKGSKEIYQYGDDKNACFTKDSDGHQSVYFLENKMLFQMYFFNGDNTKAGLAAAKEQTKNLLNLFGTEDKE